jgi:Glycosyltransferase family 9 (heptosyltransferase)
MSNPLHVALPLGIGDCHWVCAKLRGLSQYHGGRPIHAYVNRSPSHLSVGYLALTPMIASALESARAPSDVARQLPPSHRDPRWSTLEGSRGWNGFDYVLVANGHLERGERLETWLPELPTDFSYSLNIPPAARVRARQLAPPGSVLLYLSGIGPNRGFHRHVCSIGLWVHVAELLNAAGLAPVLIGAGTRDDLTYRDGFLAAAAGRARVHDITGQTSIAEVCAVIETAAAWVGLNSGTGIVAAMMGRPTVMLWSDSRYPIPGAVEPLHTNMRTSWLVPSQLARYRTISYGSSELTAVNVVARTLEVVRG